MLYVTAYLFVFDPTDIVCRLRVTMHSMGYALCFGVMIAKATQLRNAETIGFSNAIHISYWNYWLLLFFILGVQIALSVRWLAEQFMSSIVLDGSQMRMLCTFGVEEFLLSQAYVVVLLLLALFINSRNRNIKRNYKVLEHLTEGQWRLQVSNYIFLVIITLLLMVALAVLVLVCVKLYMRVVKGNQSLGISLLVGIIMLYVTAYLFVFDPTDIVCRLRVTMHSMGYALCFGVMIAKATQLRNAETIGFSNAIHISYWNYWLLLFFILGVQIALSVRWLAEQFMSSIVLDGSQMRMLCTFGVEEFLLSQAYVVVLLLLALFINSRNRNIKRNYKETKWLFLAAVTCVLLWIAWVIAFIVVPYPHKDMIVVIELVLCASVLLAFLFGPKIYILLSYEPVVVEYDAQVGKGKDAVYDNGLFEKDDELKRSVSPSSSAGSAKSSIYTKHNTIGPQANSSLNGVSSDDQAPIFHTVMRKKNRVRRARSEHSARSPSEVRHQYVMPSNAIAILPRSPTTTTEDASKGTKKQRNEPNSRSANNPAVILSFS
ncbi:putative metabotropic glutamate receptor mgl-1 [Toxocara canis]|uniref:Putative metabotropic glutamate receptor mgl-1 n=1 Tax=Toxocara canis TaxID=6265 RepID=A0A0B2V4K8_TOXCA|nr:putative metabotropic glutamate receptor mgl-1 [Toxocara canis]